MRFDILDVMEKLYVGFVVLTIIVPLIILIAAFPIHALVIATLFVVAYLVGYAVLNGRWK